MSAYPEVTIDAVATSIAQSSTGDPHPVGWYNEKAQERLRATAKAALDVLGESFGSVMTAALAYRKAPSRANEVELCSAVMAWAVVE